MPSFNSTSGSGGIGGLITGMIVVGMIITLVTGTVIHWPFIVLGIVSGLLAARIVR